MACESINLKNPTVIPLSSTETTHNGLFDIVKSIIDKKQDNEKHFYILELDVLKYLMDKWTRNLPTVQPFYAVKCNPDPSLLSAMAALGSSFDCASQAEIEAILSLGVSPDRIIFANPCKLDKHIKYAAEVGVNLTTFDSEYEVLKIRKHHPSGELLVRIIAPDEGQAKFPLGKKCGALSEEVEPLLRAAQAAELRVVGVSFHIGSSATSGDAYRRAIEEARKVFDMAARIGLPKMRLLDAGGGFMAVEPCFEAAVDTITSALAKYFGDEPGFIVIAEPGRFFAEPVFTLATHIFSKRVRGEVREYWINDGTYGSMSCVFWDDNPEMNPTPFACMSSPRNPMCHGERTYTSTVFGPTNDSADTVLTNHELPELQVNDWLIFPRMGAYTKAVGTNFNGFDTASILTYIVNSNNLSKCLKRCTLNKGISEFDMFEISSIKM